MQDGTPALFLLALDADELRLVTGRGVAAAVGGGGGGVAASATQWLLVAWIPDDSKVSCQPLVVLHTAGRVRLQGIDA